MRQKTTTLSPARLPALLLAMLLLMTAAITASAEQAPAPEEPEAFWDWARRVAEGTADMFFTRSPQTLSDDEDMETMGRPATSPFRGDDLMKPGFISGGNRTIGDGIIHASEAFEAVADEVSTSLIQITGSLAKALLGVE